MLTSFIIPGLMQLLLGFNWTGPIVLWTFPVPPAAVHSHAADPNSTRHTGE